MFSYEDADTDEYCLESCIDRARSRDVASFWRRDPLLCICFSTIQECLFRRLRQHLRNNGLLYAAFSANNHGGQEFIDRIGRRLISNNELMSASWQSCFKLDRFKIALAISSFMRLLSFKYFPSHSRPATLVVGPTVIGCKTPLRFSGAIRRRLQAPYRSSGASWGRYGLESSPLADKVNTAYAAEKTAYPRGASRWSGLARATTGSHRSFEMPSLAAF